MISYNFYYIECYILEPIYGMGWWELFSGDEPGEEFNELIGDMKLETNRYLQE
jgi:hypothetical protein